MNFSYWNTFGFVIIGLFSGSCQSNTESTVRERVLWYTDPATHWEEALPIGNGRLAAMDYGGLDTCIFQFNEESLWAGKPYSGINPNGPQYIDSIRQLLFSGNQSQANQLAIEHLEGRPKRFRSYQTFGSLNVITHNLENKEPVDYQRALSLNQGISSTTIKTENNLITRKFFASAADNLFVLHINAELPIDISIFLDREKDIEVNHDKKNTLLLRGQIIDQPRTDHGEGGKHMRFAAIASVLEHDGVLEKAKQPGIRLSGIKRATIVWTAATDYNFEKMTFDRSTNPETICGELLSSVMNVSFDQLKNRHIKRFRPLFERVELDLGGHSLDTLPTNVRLERIKNGKVDHDLISLYFQYGRYLLMSSSAFFAQLPANLQGKWNPHLNAPWNSDYHTNINLQMNYWPAQVTNLSETISAYHRFFRNLISQDSSAADLYGIKGWGLHHATNIFGYTGVNASVRWGMFPLGGCWASLPVYREYEFSNDTTYLKNKVWPILKKSVTYLLEFMTEGPDGYLVTAPSYSPENTFISPQTGKKAQLTFAPTMDIMIAREILTAARKTITTLGGEEELLSSISYALQNLPPIKVGADSTIMEWYYDYEDAEPGHRHISHLFGLHPGNSITIEDPILFEAAEKTIQKRLLNGGAGTGWSRAWIINMYARLKDEENAYYHLLKLLEISTLKNLFDTHPPFQIDGNFGGTSGIAEMLLQSHEAYVHVLPALPTEWENGKVKGLRARGGLQVAINWTNGELDQIILESTRTGLFEIRYNDMKKTVSLEKGEQKIIRSFDAN